jgi:hypothetical protein
VNSKIRGGPEKYRKLLLESSTSPMPKLADPVGRVCKFLPGYAAGLYKKLAGYGKTG